MCQICANYWSKIGCGAFSSMPKTKEKGKMHASNPPKQKARRVKRRAFSGSWLRGTDLNGRPSGYEPDELPGCSTPRIFWKRH